EGLRQPGYADEQAVAPGEDSDEQLLDDALLADDGLAQLIADASVAVVEPLDGRQVALDARPLGKGGSLGGHVERLDLEQDGTFLGGRLGAVGGQPRAAATKTTPPGGDLHEETTVGAADVRHEEFQREFSRTNFQHPMNVQFPTTQFPNKTGLPRQPVVFV